MNQPVRRRLVKRNRDTGVADHSKQREKGKKKFLIRSGGGQVARRSRGLPT